MIVRLAEKLDVSGQKCACPKAGNGEPCTKNSPPGGAAAKNAKLQKLQDLDRSSAELEAELLDLAKLLHCSYHASSKWHAKRVKHWLGQGIFDAEGSVRPPPSISDQLKGLLVLSDVQCAGIYASDRRCRRKVGGQKVQNAAKTVLALLQPVVYLDEQIRNFAIEVLIFNTFCGSHVHQGTSAGQTLKERISNFLSKEPGSGLTSRTEMFSEETTSILQGFHSRLTPNLCWPVAFDDKVFVTEVLADRPRTPEDCHTELRRRLTSKLSRTDQQDGFVYLYQANNNEPFVKIGYTGKSSAQERIKDWAFDCNRTLRLIYPDPKTLSVRVPRARRVEALCHQELAYARELVQCQACDADHMEWFRLPAGLAIGVIQKWTSWMRTEPYGDEYLASDLASKTRNMPEFMRSLSAAHSVVRTNRVGPPATINQEDALAEAVEVTPVLVEEDTKFDPVILQSSSDIIIQEEAHHDLVKEEKTEVLEVEFPGDNELSQEGIPSTQPIECRQSEPVLEVEESADSALPSVKFPHTDTKATALVSDLSDLRPSTGEVKVEERDPVAPEPDKPPPSPLADTESIRQGEDIDQPQ